MMIVDEAKIDALSGERGQKPDGVGNLGYQCVEKGAFFDLDLGGEQSGFEM